mmetsp:Transcript_13222/g.15558  ORF Transcript_13222/g.15558 Transcript_13222/m.15558 type:complete len:117 (+) Transcript_13222:279-629(+)
MSEADEKTNEVFSCISRNVDVTGVPYHFFFKEANEIQMWKNKATIFTLEQLELEYNDDSDDGDMMYGYDDTQKSIERGSILKDAYANYVNGLSSCTPLFAHLYNNDIDHNILKWDC